MTYQEIINTGFAWVGFIYDDRVILIKISSIKPEDLTGWIFTNVVKNRVPMFKKVSISQSIASDALLS